VAIGDTLEVAIAPDGSVERFNRKYATETSHNRRQECEPD
jgi:hypothetical protein